MAQLNFTQNSETKLWEATCTVNGDFNLHVERTEVGYITIDVSTVDGGDKQCVYANRESKVFDHDFDAIVYPKYIKVTSFAEPVSGKNYVTEEN